jgi:hypothetical protein
MCWSSPPSTPHGCTDQRGEFVNGLLTQALTQAEVRPSDLLAFLYCAAEDDLMAILRLAAALPPQQRAQAVDMLWAMLEAGETAQS